MSDQSISTCVDFSSASKFTCASSFTKIKQTCSNQNMSDAYYSILSTNPALYTNQQVVNLNAGYNLIQAPFGAEFSVKKNWIMGWKQTGTGAISLGYYPDGLADFEIVGGNNQRISGANRFYMRAFVSRPVIVSTFNLYKKGAYNITVVLGSMSDGSSLGLGLNVSVYEAITGLSAATNAVNNQCALNTPCTLTAK